MKLVSASLCSLASFGGLAFAQDLAPVQPAPEPVYAGRYIVDTEQFIPAQLQRGGAGTDHPIYVNTATGASSFYYNVAAGGYTVYDEGRIPSTTSTPIVGTQDSYALSSLQLGYATDEPTMTIRLELYERFAPCGDPTATATAIATINLIHVPGSTVPGTLQAFIIDVDLPDGICIRADGDGVFDGMDDGFGWSFRTTNTGNGGPLIRGHPAAVAPGNGTYFSNPNAPTGTGLDTVSGFRREDVTGTGGCFSFGAYDPSDNNPPFASFYLVLRSGLYGDCIGCGIGDDRFEDNDALLESTPVSYGIYPDLVLENEDDWFATNIPAGSDIVVRALFSDAISDIDLRLIDGLSGVTLRSSTSTTDDEVVAYVNCNPFFDVPVFIRVNNFGGACNVYDLVIAHDPLCLDDALENNDSCATRVPLPLGATTGLIVRPSCGATGGDDSDFYGVTLDPGQSLTVDILFSHAIADIDLVLYDSTLGCNGVTLDTGFTTTDNEYCVASNLGATPMNVTVRVDFFNGICNRYDLIACVTDSPGLGGSICAAVPNSTGRGAVLCAEGSLVALANDVTLGVVDLPLNSAGFFFTSPTALVIANPGSSVGNICIASPSIGRYSGSVLNSGALGEVSLRLDLANTPQQPGGPIAVMAGDTRYWQYWYRDSVGGMAVSNFSSALCVSFL